MNNEIPKHVAIVPDGNRRWARERGMREVWKGHEKAGEYENVKNLVNAAREIGIKYLSVWVFSTENWKRNEPEKKKLFDIIRKLVNDCEKDAHEKKIRLKHVGRKDRIPRELRKDIERVEKATENYYDFFIVLCLDYGGRDEIIRATKRLIEEGREVNEEEFSNCLDTAEIPDVDLIIRTGGDKRMSGFMPFQSVYSELYFTDVLFPDFNAEELKKAVEEFGKRKRRFGG